MKKKKIAILACLQANDVCAGAACLKAMDKRTAAFSAYQGQEVSLCAFARCSHCQTHLADDPGMLEKLERIVSEQIGTVHIGICATAPDRSSPCPYMLESAAWLENHGVEVIWGTH